MLQYALRDLCGFKNLEWYADNCDRDVILAERYLNEVEGRFDDNGPIAAINEDTKDTLDKRDKMESSK